MIVEVAKPDQRDREAFRVVEFSLQYSFENVSAIPGLWRSFNAKVGDVVGAVDGAAYGAGCEADETGQFRYVASVETAEKTNGMDCRATRATNAPGAHVCAQIDTFSSSDQKRFF